MNLELYIVKDTNCTSASNFINSINAFLLTKDVQAAKERYVINKKYYPHSKIFKVKIPVEYCINALNAACHGDSCYQDLEIIHEVIVPEEEMLVILNKRLKLETEEKIARIKSHIVSYNKQLDEENKKLKGLSDLLNKNKEISLTGAILGSVATNIALSVFDKTSGNFQIKEEMKSEISA